MHNQPLRSLALILPVALGLLALGACGRAPETAQQTVGEAAAPAAQQAPAEADRAAELAAKERELADREAALKQKEIEQELARRDAENAAAIKAASRPPAVRKPAAAPKAASVATAPVPPRPAAPPPPIVVPAGTPLSIELVSALSTRTSQVGDRVQARLAADLTVAGRRAAAAGSAVQGSVTQVVSGSKKVGGTPTLGITFDGLTAGSGAAVGINAQFVQQAASDTGKDTAKIVGGAAAGAIIGHQVSHKNGAIVGGILGGATGTAVARNTGGEVSLPAGTVVSVALAASIQVNGN